MTEALGGAQVIVNLSASPVPRGLRAARRERMLVQRAVDYLAAVVFVNTVGGQDELVFDGHSLAIDQDGERARPRAPVRGGAHASARSTRARSWRRACATPATARTCADQRPQRRRRRAARVHAGERATVELATASWWPASCADRSSPRPEVYAALRTGLRDYVEKNGFEHVVLGALRRDRLRARGADRRRRARARARDLRVDAVPLLERGHARRRARDRREPRRRLPRDPHRGGDGRLRRDAAPRPSTGTEPDIAEENLQARIRGNVVMALSNKFGWLVLTTGNKSELSVGYATLYGDMAGGFAVLKDVYKGWVYRLVRWRNEQARPRARAGLGARAAAVRRAPRTTSATRTRCRPTTCSTRSSRATSRRTSTPIELVRRGLPADRGRARDRDGRPRRVQAPPGAARDQDLHEGVRPRPAAADHEPLRDERTAPERRPRRSSGDAGASAPARPRPATRSIWLAALAVPLARPLLLLAAPSADCVWEHHPSHFWLVLGRARSPAPALALTTSGIALRRADARLFLVSLAFLAAAGFLGLHALATPGVAARRPNQGFTSPPRSGC